MGKISRDCDKDVTGGKNWSSRRFLREGRLKLVQIEPRSTHQKKRIMLDYQLTVLLVIVRTNFSENSEPV